MPKPYSSYLSSALKTPVQQDSFFTQNTSELLSTHNNNNNETSNVSQHNQTFEELMQRSHSYQKNTGGRGGESQMGLGLARSSTGEKRRKYMQFTETQLHVLRTQKRLHLNMQA